MSTVRRIVIALAALLAVAMSAAAVLMWRLSIPQRRNHARNG